MELILLTVWSKVGEGVDLVRDEVYLVPRADLHQLQGELPAVDRAQGVVGVAVEKPPHLLTELALGEDGLLQQAPTEGEGLVVLLCKAESQMGNIQVSRLTPSRWTPTTSVFILSFMSEKKRA